MSQICLVSTLNRDYNKLAINKLARDLFCFGLFDRITRSMLWVPREENAFSDESSELLTPDNWILVPKFVDILIVSAMVVLMLGGMCR